MGLKASKQLPADQAVRGDVSGHNIIITGGTNGMYHEHIFRQALSFRDQMQLVSIYAPAMHLIL